MLAATLEHEAAERLAHFVERHPDLLILSGAGISTASGIPDYRDKDGRRRGNPPIQGPDFRRHEAVRRRYWARSMVGWPALARAQPNPGHLAIAELQAGARVASLVTQNVDGLHQRAGSRQVTELHGSIHSVVCLDCCALLRAAWCRISCSKTIRNWPMPRRRRMAMRTWSHRGSTPFACRTASTAAAP
ncbi:Sir2 family NAD-dependent protein deacetylase [Janthinobacterium agaricidamnosum]